MKTKSVNKLFVFIAVISVMLAAAVMLNYTPRAYAAEAGTIETVEVPTTYQAGQTTGRLLKFTETENGTMEVNVKLKTVAAALEKLVLMGFYSHEGAIPNANPANTNKGVSFVDYPTGELEAYNNVGWKQLTAAGGSVQLFGDGKTVTFTLAREINSGNVEYKLYYTPLGGEKVLWENLSSGLNYNGYTYSFGDDDILIDGGYTYFGVNVFTDARNLTVYDYKTTVNATVTELTGAAERYASIKAYAADGTVVPIISASLTATGLTFTSQNPQSVAKLEFTTAGGIVTEFDLNADEGTCDSALTLGSDSEQYTKTVKVVKGSTPITDATVKIFDGNTDITKRIGIVNNGDGTYTIKGVGKNLTAEVSGGNADATVNLTADKADYEVNLIERFVSTVEILDYKNAPVAGLENAIKVYENDEAVSTAEVNYSNGKYEVSGLYDSGEELTLVFDAAGYERETAVISAADSDVTINAVQVYSVELTLIDAAFEPIAGAENNIKVYNVDEEIETVVITYSDGKYLITGIRRLADEQTIKFAKDKYTAAECEVTLADSDAGVTLSSERTVGYIATVTVKDENGGEVSGVRVTALDGVSEFTYDAESKEWRISDVNKDLKVAVSAAGYNAVILTLTEDNPTAQAVLTVLKNEITGEEVTYPEEKPIGGNQGDGGEDKGKGCGSAAAGSVSAFAGAAMVLAFAALLAIKKRRAEK